MTPLFAPVDDGHLALAQDLVRLFERHVGARRADLVRDLTEHELRLGTRFKLVRGLATLLERRAHFEMATRVDPSRARRAVYDAAARLERGAATTPEARSRVLAAAAGELHLTVEELQMAAVADAEENLVLVAFDAPRPERLLHRYNLGLAQTLLFDAVRLELEVERGFRELLGLVKLNGLMHVVERPDDGWHRIVVDGPVSLFRDTRRYGTGMAKVLPALVRCGRWRLAAEVQERETGRLRWFRTDSEALPVEPLGSAADEEAPTAADDAPVFDSALERRFAEDWAGLRSAWRVVREPAALPVGGGEVFLPDFGFAWRDGPVRAYLEIVGYWTPAYLARKVEKLRRLPSGMPLLLAVDASLGVGEDAFAEAPAEVLFYKGSVPLVPVVQWLRSIEQTLVDEEAARLAKGGGIDARAPVLRVADVARRHGVSAGAAERALAALDLGERVRVGDALVAPRVLDELAAALSPGMRVDAVEALARERGLGDTSSLLSRLGYTAVWQGLDPTSAVIRPRAG